jgi:hypothetical protein
MGRGQEAVQMPQKRNIKRRSTRSTLRLPDLDHTKNSVLQSVGSAASKRASGPPARISSAGIAPSRLRFELAANATSGERRNRILTDLKLVCHHLAMEMLRR